MGRKSKDSLIDSEVSEAMQFWDFDFTRSTQRVRRRKCRICKGSWCKNRCKVRPDVDSRSRIMARNEYRRGENAQKSIQSDQHQTMKKLETSLDTSSNSVNLHTKSIWDAQLKPEESEEVNNEIKPNNEQVTIPAVYQRAVEELSRKREERPQKLDEGVVSPIQPSTDTSERKQSKMRQVLSSRSWFSATPESGKLDEEEQSILGFIRRASSQIPKLFSNVSRPDLAPPTHQTVINEGIDAQLERGNRRGQISSHALEFNKNTPSFLYHNSFNTDDEVPCQLMNIKRRAENAFSCLRRKSKLRKEPTFADAQMYVSMAFIKKHYGDYKTAERYFTRAITIGRKCGACKIWIADVKLALAIVINDDESRLVMAESLLKSVLKRYTACKDEDENGEIALFFLIENLEQQKNPHAVLEACAKYLHFMPSSFQSAPSSIA